MLGFSLYASISRKEWWKVEKEEVDPFSQQGADLLNRTLGKYAQQVKDGGDVTSVALGMLAIIYSRSQMDAAYKLQLQQRAQQQRQQEEESTNEPAQAYVDTTSSNGNSGKVPVTIFGNVGGLS